MLEAPSTPTVPPWKLRKVCPALNLFRSKGGGDLCVAWLAGFAGRSAADVLVEHAAELVEANGSIVIYVGHVEHLGQRLFPPRPRRPVANAGA